MMILPIDKLGKISYNFKYDSKINNILCRQVDIFVYCIQSVKSRQLCQSYFCGQAICNYLRKI